MHSEIDLADKDANRTKADINAAIAYYEAIPANERSGDDVDQLAHLKGVKTGIVKAELKAMVVQVFSQLLNNTE